MNINLNNFKNFIKKATLNFSIDNVHMKINPKKVISKMTNSSEDAIILLETDNDILPEIKDEVNFWFNDPRSSIIKQIDMIDSNKSSILIKDDSIILKHNKQRGKIHFCSPVLVSVFDRSMIPDIDHKILIHIDDEFISIFNKIKKFGSQFKNIYFLVESGKLYVESTDKTNDYADSLRLEICDTDSLDWRICVDYKNFVNLMNVIIDNYSDYQIKWIFIEENEAGMINIFNDSENYILISKIE